MTGTFVSGEVLLAPGLDQNCFPCVVPVIFVRWLEESERKTGFDCVTESQGLQALACSDDLRRP